MATVITSECINCGACEPECPNTAIYQGGVEWQAQDGSMHPALSNDIFYIVPEKCTECVGFYDHEACAAVCPVDCCVPDPERPETEAALLVRARALHPDKTIPDDAPSRFRKDGAVPEPKSNGHDVAAAPVAAAAPAAAPRPAAPAPAPKPVAGVRGRVEKAVAKPAGAPRPAPSFAGELSVDFEQLLADLGTPRRRHVSRLGRIGLSLLFAAQGVLGALGAGFQERIDAAVADRRFFDPALATAGNVFLNLVLYPLVIVLVVVLTGRVDPFTSNVHKWIVLGVAIAVAEAMLRLRESFFGGLPFGQTRVRPALYAPVVLPLGALVLALAGRRGTEGRVGFDGFYGERDGGNPAFDEKVERDRRYGSIYKVEDRDDAYILRLEFPRRLPPSSLADELGLPHEMPDYDYQLSLQDGTFVVHGRVADPQVRKLSAVAPAFPPEFTTRVPLRDPVAGFRHRYRDKTLEVILPKAGA